MSFNADTLYSLLPAIYRIRDAEQGEPLKALIAIIAEQAEIFEEDLAQYYDDLFIETCAPWVIPYIGDLIGYRPLYGTVPKISSPRAEVANTLAYRRRKGTVSVLEQLARDVTGWDAKVVEYFQLLATTQYLNHIRSDNRVTVDLRDWEALERLNSPFETTTYTVEVRRISVQRGRYNIPNIGIFMWRLQPYSLTQSLAFKLTDDPLDRRYLFSPLGNNTQLFHKPVREDQITHLAEPINVPEPISRRVLAADVNQPENAQQYYGREQSLTQLLNESGNVKSLIIAFGENGNVTEIAPNQVKICDLSDIKDENDDVVGWAHVPTNDRIAIDPVLGRIAIPESFLADPTQSDVLVTYHYGFSANLGGGEYDRTSSLDLELQPQAVVDSPGALQFAIDLFSAGGVVEIADSGRYEAETLSIALDAVPANDSNNQQSPRFELRAANEKRPTLLLSDGLQINAVDGSVVTLNGLLITGSSLRIIQTSNALVRWKLRLRHCTLVPGLSLSVDGEPQQPSEPSLMIYSENANTSIDLEIDNCIVGALAVTRNTEVRITNSIIDATAPAGIAYSASANDSEDSINVVNSNAAAGALTVENSTIIGKVHTTQIEASNTIFFSQLAEDDTWNAPVIAERRQQGCVRFSYVPLESQVPRRYNCQPEIASQALNVLPRFTSLRYGVPGYAQLTQRCAVEIRQGADDESEMGVFHDLYQSQRETNLRVRLGEYLRFGLEAGIFYVT